MLSNFQYVYIILFPLAIFLGICLSFFISQEQDKSLLNLFFYENNNNLNLSINEKLNSLNKELEQLGLVYDLEQDLFYSLDNDSTLDKLRSVSENNRLLYEEIKNLGQIKHLM
ncbi:hypothetical protein [Anaerovorax odorimutans]|uniref:hypothetical protein n=1 Tax=Anaerovorax odorimutans TaxID=109327 RepID=UPI00041FDC5C|nr:hypothetical protein [Anaerovorax odorimutans]